MDFNNIQNLVMNNTVPSRWNRGIKNFNRKLVDHITVNINDGIVTFDAIAESEFFNDVYTTSISIDTINNKILVCSCTCETIFQDIIKAIYLFVNILLQLV